MPGGIGPLELAIVLVIVLVVFGPKRLPGLGRSLGSGMREFKDSITGSSKDDDDETGDKPTIAQSSAGTEPSPQPATTAERDDAVPQSRG